MITIYYPKHGLYGGVEIQVSVNNGFNQSLSPGSQINVPLDKEINEIKFHSINGKLAGSAKVSQESDGGDYEISTFSAFGFMSPNRGILRFMVIFAICICALFFVVKSYGLISLIAVVGLLILVLIFNGINHFLVRKRGTHYLVKS